MRCYSSIHFTFTADAILKTYFSINCWKLNRDFQNCIEKSRKKFMKKNLKNMNFPSDLKIKIFHFSASSNQRWRNRTNYWIIRSMEPKWMVKFIRWISRNIKRSTKIEYKMSTVSTRMYAILLTKSVASIELNTDSAKMLGNSFKAKF